MTNIDTRGIGDNIDVDYAQPVNDRLAQEYGEHIRNIDELLGKAATLPTDVTSDDEAVSLGAIIKQLRDSDARMEAFRETEKTPFLRGGNAVDNFFNSIRDRLAKRKKMDRSVQPGMIDILQSRIDVWQNKKIAEETARLTRERMEADRKAREEIARAHRLRVEAEQAAQAAARARSEATREQRNAVADAAREREAIATAQAELAAAQAEEAQRATLISRAEMTRVRGTSAGAGVLLTTAKDPYANLVDRRLIDMEALRPFFTDNEIEKALRAWARTTGHRVQMAGAEIGIGNKGVTR